MSQSDPEPRVPPADARPDQDDVAGMVREFRKALEMNPEDAAVHCQLGMTHARAGQLVEAIAAFRGALGLRSDYPEARFNLAGALALTGDVDAAIEEFREVVRLTPNDYAARTALGLLLRTTGNIDAAIAELEEAVRLKPDAPDAQARLLEAVQQKEVASKRVDAGGPGLAT